MTARAVIQRQHLDELERQGVDSGTGGGGSPAVAESLRRGQGAPIAHIAVRSAETRQEPRQPECPAVSGEAGAPVDAEAPADAEAPVEPNGRAWIRWQQQQADGDQGGDNAEGATGGDGGESARSFTFSEHYTYSEAVAARLRAAEEKLSIAERLDYAALGELSDACATAAGSCSSSLGEEEAYDDDDIEALEWKCTDEFGLLEKGYTAAAVILAQYEALVQGGEASLETELVTHAIKERLQSLSSLQFESLETYAAEVYHARQTLSADLQERTRPFAQTLWNAADPERNWPSTRLPFGEVLVGNRRHGYARAASGQPLPPTGVQLPDDMYHNTFLL